MTKLDDFVTAEQDRMLEELKELLRIPSVSTDPSHKSDCRKAGEWMMQHLEAMGCIKAELLASDEYPVVHAEGPERPGKPTVVIYGHYDVQPPDPLDLWESPPFEPTVRDGNLYARGATDDKGQVFAVVFLIEGQEETGSNVLWDLLDQRPELTEADAVIVSDTPYFAPGWPAIEAGLRGICYGEIKVRTLKGDLHSGLYGGVAPNAHETLVRILAKLKSSNGRIKIPGLYEAVKRPSKAERKAWGKLPFKEHKFMRDEVGAEALTGLTSYSVFERLWALPTFEIHGITGGFTGEGAKTVIPAEATAKVSLRLVPNQREKSVRKQLKRALKAIAPDYADVSVEFIHGADPVLVDVTGAAVQKMDRAFREVEGRGAVPIRSGGSIPVVAGLGKSGAPVILSGIGLPDDNLHAPNEKIAVDQFLKGVKVFGTFLNMMAE
jgi:acetylornithine deacetylase/succinyl-diaminopimelate desuccinylase-like protein